ncbi:hypothetical protein ACFLWG_01560 [Chloroflexota bacterium]
MDIDKKVDALEDEFKLIKGELKQTLEGVRNHLLETPIPASEYATIMAAIGGGGGGGGGTMTGKLSFDRGNDKEERFEEELIEEELPEEALAEEEFLEREQPGEEFLEKEQPGEEFLEREQPGEEFREGELPGEEFLEREQPGEEFLEREQPGEEFREGESREGELPEQRMEHGNNGEVSQSIPPVNLMANLIRWVANAKREIGDEQLSAFLEVYGITGHLSPELKEVILYLADIASEQPADTNAAEIWTHLMLGLHGILTGSEAPLHPVVRPFWNDGGSETPTGVLEAEVAAGEEEDRPQDKPIKLKLVFPNSDGVDKEFGIVLNPEVGRESP